MGRLSRWLLPVAVPPGAATARERDSLVPLRRALVVAAARRRAVGVRASSPLKKCFAAESEGFFGSTRTRTEGESERFVEFLGRR